MRAWLLLLWVCGTALADETARRRFETEAPGAWSELKTAIQTAVAFRAVSVRGPLSGAPDARYVTRYCLLGSRQLFEDTDARGIQRVTAANDAYAFELRRPSSRDAWVVTKLTFAPDPARQDRTIAFAGLLVEGKWVEDLIHWSDFRLQSVKAESPTRYCVVFQAHHVFNPVNIIEGGTLWFDPQRYWTLVAYDLIAQSDVTGRITAELSYQDLDGYPFPRQTVVNYMFPPKTLRRHVCDYGPVSRATREADYRLAAFGLPEPRPASSTASRGWTWLIVNLGLVAVLVGAVCLRKHALQHKG